MVYDNGRLPMRGSPDPMADHWGNYIFPEVPHRHFAEQLTRMDAEVFRKLVAHQCLGAVWSRKDRSRSHEAATVVATVNQFNAVSLRVISTILTDTTLKSQERARILETWIDVAQELRILKNFSSLKAIVSGLQSNPVYRLEKCWQCMPREKHELFRELERIFSEENNAWTQRELLIKEGTAKFADTAGRSDRHLQKLFQKQNTHAGVSAQHRSLFREIFRFFSRGFLRRSCRHLNPDIIPEKKKNYNADDTKNEVNSVRLYL